MALYYVAHRLFAAHDRALGGYVASRLAERVGADAVFLPFCDTDEENLTADVKGWRLYELDRERLRRINGMIALLHGPSLDDGVCMEIGFAAALGVPVVVITTDFQTYGPTPGGPACAFPDPLIEMLAARIVRVHRLAPARPGRPASRFEEFIHQNLAPLAEAADVAAGTLAAWAADPPAHASADNGEPAAFLEPSPHAEGDIWAGIAGHLRASGWKVHTAGRLRAGEHTRLAAQADWDAIRRACLAVVDVSGPETPPGAALITGACAATGRRVLATGHRSWWTFADGREPNWRNLMIHYAVRGRFTSIREFAGLVAAP